MDLSTGVAVHFYYLGMFVAPFILFQMFAGGLRDAWRDLGYVAETTPKCGTAQRFSLARVGIASSVLFMPMSKGVLRDSPASAASAPENTNARPPTMPRSRLTRRLRSTS